MEEHDPSEHTFEHKSPFGTELVMIHPVIQGDDGITGRYIITLAGPEIIFEIERDETGVWKCENLPAGVDPDLVSWAGNEIERYYK